MAFMQITVNLALEVVKIVMFVKTSCESLFVARNCSNGTSFLLMDYEENGNNLQFCEWKKEFKNRLTNERI